MSSNAQPSILVHATEEILEEYSFGRICEPQLGRLEDHLLICPRCHAALGEIDEYKMVMKVGLAALEPERLAAAALMAPPPSAAPGPRLRSPSPLPFALPRIPVAKTLLASTLLLVAAGITLDWRMRPTAAIAPVASIRLIALRGGETDIAHAPVGRPLHLVFDRSDLPSDPTYRAEVVNSSGRQMWSGSVQIADQNLSIPVAEPLRAGTYWVRLYSLDGQLLREFGLNVA
jgi:hypothetical protein